MTAEERAHEIGRAVETRSYSSPILIDGPLYRVVSGFRTHLILMSDEGLLKTAPNEIGPNLKKREVGPFLTLTYGEVFDKGQATGTFLHRNDGARISFSIQFEPSGATQLKVVSYRFHLRFPTGSQPEFLRFDLGQAHQRPLLHPRFHAHIGTKELRIPIPALAPLEALVFALHAEL